MNHLIDTMLKSHVNEKKFADTASVLIAQAKFGITEMADVQGVMQVMTHLAEHGARIITGEQVAQITQMSEQYLQLEAEVRRLTALAEGIAPPASLAATPTVAIDCTPTSEPVAVAEEVVPPGAE